MDIERRYTTTEIRAFDEPGLPQRLIGYAAVWDSPSLDLGGFREIVRRGAFLRALQSGGDVRALVDHDPLRMLGRQSSGTLRLAEDDHGLRYEIDVPDTTYARDLVSLIRRRDIRGSSFAFTVRRSGQSWRGTSASRIREIRDVESLQDVSVVTTPAYPATDVALRHLADWQQTMAANRQRLARVR